MKIKLINKLLKSSNQKKPYILSLLLKSIGNYSNLANQYFIYIIIII